MHHITHTHHKFSFAAVQYFLSHFLSFVSFINVESIEKSTKTDLWFSLVGSIWFTNGAIHNLIMLFLFKSKEIKLPSQCMSKDCILSCEKFKNLKIDCRLEFFALCYLIDWTDCRVNRSHFFDLFITVLVNKTKKKNNKQI